MNHNRMVDLLLVRLTREDEKIKVIDLLMSELGMSSEEAQEKVDNSPIILSEGIEMEQGRILQDRMYPFVDLLPRHYNGDSEGSPVPGTESEGSPFELITDDIHPVTNENEKPEEAEESDGIFYDQSAVNEEEDTGYKKSFSDEDDDSLIITSASDEMLTVERCHICGRTPVGDQKLAPCQTCTELTCSDCYNRKYHVCEKCASEGRAVDRPLDSVPEARRDTYDAGGSGDFLQDSSQSKYRSEKTAKRSFGPMPVVLIFLILAAAFLVIDPMHLFSSTDNGTEDITEDDTNSHLLADTTLVPEVDTTVTADDSLLADSLVFRGPVSLTDISLPDSLGIVEEYSLPRILTSSPVAGIEIHTDSLSFIAEFMGQLSSIYSIEFDGISLIRTEDGFNILLMSILHPEPAEKRAAMLGSLGTMLDMTVVDQMVLYYRENQYYAAEMFTFIADSFYILAQSSSPYFLQRKQAIIPETVDLVTGRILDWMTDLN